MLAFPIGLHTSPVAGSALLLDSLSVTVRGAWGMRKLRNAYAGACIRVRRDSDNAEQDIGFVSGNLDTANLTTFVGSNSGYITKWYDQSSAAVDMVQTTATRQPRIRNSGTTDSLGNVAAKPALYFVDNTMFLAAASFTLGSTTTVSSHSIGQGPSGTTDGAARFLSFVGNGETNDYTNTNSLIFAYFDGGTTANGFTAGGRGTVTTAGTTPWQLSSVWDGTNNTMYSDGNTGSPSSYSGTFASPGTLYTATEGGATGSNEQWATGRMSEHIVVSGTLSSTDRTTIRSSQKTYYGTT